jgi:hypothetical protein
MNDIDEATHHTRITNESRNNSHDQWIDQIDTILKKMP